MERPSHDSRPPRAGGQDPASPGPAARGGSGAGIPFPGSSRRRRARRAGPTLGENLRRAGGNASEIFEYLKTMLSVRADRAVATTQRTLTNAAVGVLGGVAALVLIFCGVLRFVEGTAGGLSALFGGRPWAGDLAAGVLLLGGLAGGAAWFLGRRRRKSFENMKAKYERLHAEHRARFGHHVADALSGSTHGSSDSANGGGAPRPGGGAGVRGSDR